MRVVAAPVWPNISQMSQISKAFNKARVHLVTFTCFQVPSQTLEASAVAFAPFAPAG